MKKKTNKIKTFFAKEKLGLGIGIFVGFLVVLSVFLQKNNSFSCLLLDNQYCSLGKPVYNQAKEFIGIGFKLPVGSKIYAPFEKAKLDEKQINLVQIGTNFYPAGVLLDTTAGSSCETKTFLMAYGSPQLNTSQESFKKGEPFAYAGKTVVNKDLGDYDLILGFREFDSKAGGWRNNLDLLKQFFPDLIK